MSKYIRAKFLEFYSRNVSGNKEHDKGTLCQFQSNDSLKCVKLFATSSIFFIKRLGRLNSFVQHNKVNHWELQMTECYWCFSVACWLSNRQTWDFLVLWKNAWPMTTKHSSDVIRQSLRKSFNAADFRVHWQIICTSYEYFYEFI